MDEKKTLRQREVELQALLATPKGREQLEDLASRYGAVSGRVRACRTSLVTYILVHERERHMIE
jgi:hypothetical protein